MSPATELAAHHLFMAKRSASGWFRRFHLRAALLVIAACGGRRVRSEARQLLRGMV